jgi:phosphate transport system substrate-binding protein
VALRSRVLLAAAIAVPLALATACGGNSAGADSGSGNTSSGNTSSGNTSSGNAGSLDPPAAAGGGIPSGPAPGSQSISENGSSLLYPLMQTWAAAYHQRHPNVSISTGKLGSKVGIADAADGRVNIGASDAYLPSAILVEHSSLLNIPLAVSAQQINYNVPGLAPNAEVLRAALDCVLAGRPVSTGPLLGCEFTERSLRFGLERSYRTQAQLAPDRSRRIALVDRANDVRPRTWA